MHRAQELLSGQKVVVVRSEELVISGGREWDKSHMLMLRYEQRRWLLPPYSRPCWLYVWVLLLSRYYSRQEPDQVRSVPAQEDEHQPQAWPLPLPCPLQDLLAHGRWWCCVMVAYDVILL